MSFVYKLYMTLSFNIPSFKIKLTGTELDIMLLMTMVSYITQNLLNNSCAFFLVQDASRNSRKSFWSESFQEVFGLVG